MISRIDHIGIAVNDFKQASFFFQTLFNAVAGHSDTDHEMKYHWQTYAIGDLSRLELIAPTEEGGFLDNYLRRHKQGGVHHITLQTPDIYQAKRILDDHQIPYFGFNDQEDSWKEFYIHPKDAFGVLIQVAEPHPNDDDGYRRFPTNKGWQITKKADGAELRFVHPRKINIALQLNKEEIKELIGDLSAL